MEQHNYKAIDNLGYYPCYKNVLFNLQYLDSCGLNMALPLESMHVICLGYMPHIVQAFSRVQKLRAGSATEDDTNCGTHYVFGEYYKNHDQVENKLIKLGEILPQQPDPEKPTTAFTTFLIDLDPKKTCKTKKKPST